MKICIFIAAVLMTTRLTAQNPPQKINANYQFTAVGSDSVDRVPIVTPSNFYDTLAAVFYHKGDSTLRVRTNRGGNSLKVGPYSPTLSTPSAAGSDANPAFDIDVYGIPSVSNTYTAGDTIQWKFLDSSAGHSSGFVTSCYGDAATGRFVIDFPNVRRIESMIMVTDESIGPYGIQAGPTVGFNQAIFTCENFAPSGCMLIGNNTTSWNMGEATPFSISAYNTANGQTLVDLPANMGQFGYDVYGTAITYVGVNNYRIQRNLSGLGSYSMGFQLINNTTGLPVTTVPQSGDIVVISSAASGARNVNMHTFNNTNTFFGTFSNFWMRARFSAWFVCDLIDSSDIRVRYQTNYAGATVYKIYRGTSPTFGSQTLVHTGTSGSFIDTGLVQNTKYYYTEMATVSGSDLLVSTYICITENKY